MEKYENGTKRVTSAEVFQYESETAQIQEVGFSEKDNIPKQNLDSKALAERLQVMTLGNFESELGPLTEDDSSEEEEYDHEIIALRI